MVLYRASATDVSENKALMVAQGRRHDGSGSILRPEYTIQMRRRWLREGAPPRQLIVLFCPERLLSPVAPVGRGLFCINVCRGSKVSPFFFT